MENFITYQLFVQLFPRCKDPQGWYAALCSGLAGTSINTKNRLACFLAQAAHESGEFNITTENLNYSEQGLLTVFKKYFTAETAKTYARQPEKIANRVYANRMGNGDEASGDGWRYRGRGIFQLTGKTNYMSAGTAIFGDTRLMLSPDLVANTKDIAIKTAVWFWDKNKLSPMADQLNMLAITKTINGGTNGLDDRQAIFQRIYNSI